MTSFASSLSHPDWRIWILAAPATNTEPIVLDEVTEGGSDDNRVNVNGDMQDLYKFLKSRFKPIRLVVIDYAGLLMEPNDIRTFIQSGEKITSIKTDKRANNKKIVY
ncbi:unnamed protein product [Absidia cylindrospora]